METVKKKKENVHRAPSPALLHDMLLGIELRCNALNSLEIDWISSSKRKGKATVNSL